MSLPAAKPAVVVHRSMDALAQVGMGTVRRRLDVLKRQRGKLASA